MEYLIFLKFLTAHPFITQAGLLQQANGNSLSATTLSAIQSPGLSNQVTTTPTSTSGGSGGTSVSNNVAAAFANLNSLNATTNGNSANSISSQQVGNSHAGNSNQQLLIPIMQNLNDDVSKF